MAVKARQNPETPGDVTSVEPGVEPGGESGAGLAHRQPVTRRGGQTSPPQEQPADQVPEMLSALSAASAVYPDVVYLSASGLRVGDIVRSTESYWLSTRQHLTGAIVRFEPVPSRAIPVVRSDYWAYLNSGEGPVSLALIEKAPTFREES